MPSRGSHGVTCACLSLNRVCLRRVETQKRDASLTHGPCSLPPNPSSQDEPSDSTQGNIHLPVHPPSFAFSPRKKGQFFLTEDHRYQLAQCLPTTDAVGKDFIPLPPYPAAHSITPKLTRLPSSWFSFILASTV
ncbi:hypothetical protein CRENBAI_018914 [Crenichthys baileyi]|uniref:Uncharacterized protein n=1 Tax=Crenichthys baileyi TaxID=28760 RepID=A0AAV9SPW2_9TELE